MCHDDCATVSSARRGNDDRCSSSLLDWYLCINAKKSSSGTVGALAVTDAAPPVTDGSALRCSSIRAPYRTTVIQTQLTDTLFFKNIHQLTKLNNNNMTRSQAVARISDRTAKNCRGHVTWTTPTFMEIYLCACSALPIQSRVSNSKSLAQVVLKICSIVCQTRKPS